MTITPQEILDIYKGVIQAGLDEYASKGIRDAIANGLQFVYNQSQAPSEAASGFFESEAARDAYYNINFGTLTNGDIIAVNNSGVVSFQEWTGSTAPGSYNPLLWEATDFFAPQLGDLVSAAERVEDFLILNENVTVGQLVYISDTPLISGVATGGIADKDIASKRPSIGVAKESGLSGETIRIIEQGLAQADTALSAPGTIVSLGNAGAISVNPQGFNQQVGWVVEQANPGVIYLKQGSIEKAPLPIQLSNGEMIRYSTAIGGYEGTGDINTETTVDFGDKTIISGTGTFQLGESQALSSAGTNIIATNIQTGDIRSSVDTIYGTNTPIFRVVKTPALDQVQQGDKGDIVTNPFWTQAIAGDISIIDMTIEASLPQTNCRVRFLRDSEQVWSSPVFDLVPGGEQKVFNTLSTDGSVPLQIDDDGSGYQWKIDSIDGDVVLLGELTTPFYALSFSLTEDILASNQHNSTGVIDGFGVAVNTPTSVVINAGYGWIATNRGKQAIYVDLTASTAFNVDTATDGNYAIGINGAGTINQTPANGVNASYIRDNLLLGFVEVEGNIVSQATTYQLQTGEAFSQLMDLSEVLGAIAGLGLEITPQANLSFDIAAGKLGFRGSGTPQANRTPNILSLDARITAEFDRFLGITANISLANQTTIDPANYDDGSGSPVAVPAIENATIQYIYQFPFTTGGLSVMYGQTVYPTIEDALVNKDNDTITLPLEVADNALLLGRVIVRADALDLSDDAQALFLPGAKFGSAIKGGAIGTGSGGGGDTFGAASSTTDEIVTYADASGKILSSTSDYKISLGVIERIGTNLPMNLVAGTPAHAVVIEPVAGHITLGTPLNEFRVFRDDNSAKFTGEAGSSASIVVQSDNPEFGFKTQAGLDVGRLEYNDSADGKIAIRLDGTGNAIELGATDIVNRIGVTSWRQTSSGITWEAGTNTAIYQQNSDTNSIVLANAADTPQGFISYLSPNDYITLGRSAGGAEIRVESEDVDVLTKGNGRLKENDVNVVLDNVSRNALGTTGTIDLDFSPYETIYTIASTGNVTLTFSNLTIGHAVQLEFGGGFSLTFPAEAFKLSGSGDLSTSELNVIYLYVSDTNVVDYSIQQRL
jgi:hypothetical protein